MKKFLKFAIGLMVVLFLIGLFFGGDDAAKTSQQPAKSDSAAVPINLEQVTAAELAKAYEENTVAADQRFKGKRFKVKGAVSEINTGFTGEPYLVLRGGANPFMEPQFHFEKDDMDQLAKIKKGQSVTLECTGKGDVAKMPMSGKCILVQ